MSNLKLKKVGKADHSKDITCTLSIAQLKLLYNGLVLDRLSDDSTANGAQLDSKLATLQKVDRILKNR